MTLHIVSYYINYNLNFILLYFLILFPLALFNLFLMHLLCNNLLFLHLKHSTFFILLLFREPNHQLHKFSASQTLNERERKSE